MVVRVEFYSNDRLFLDEQNRIIKENIYVDYLTVNAAVLSEICTTDAGKCKDKTSILSDELSESLKDKLSGYDNSITPEFCINHGKVIVYTTYHFNISRYNPLLEKVQFVQNQIFYEMQHLLDLDR